MQLRKSLSMAKHERLGRGHIGKGQEIALSILNQHRNVIFPKILSQASIVGAPKVVLATESSVRFERVGEERSTRQQWR